MPLLNSAFFRGHAHGELINETHFVNFINSAIRNPHTNVTLWTKRKDMVNRVLEYVEKPKNLIMIYSEPRVNVINLDIPAHFDKIFNVVDSPELDSRVNCGGKSCINCLSCYQKNGESVLIERVKNQGSGSTKKFKSEKAKSK